MKYTSENPGHGDGNPSSLGTWRTNARRRRNSLQLL